KGFPREARGRTRESALRRPAHSDPVDAGDRRLVLLIAWAFVAVAYIARAPTVLRSVPFGSAAALVGLVALAWLTLAGELRAPLDTARRWRLAWALGSFHAATVSVIGASGTPLLYSEFVNVPALPSRLLVLASAMGLAGAAL